MDERRLDSLLRARKVEPPRPGFEQRVIAAAFTHTPRTFGDWVRGLLAPAPAFALALSLLLGVLLGVHGHGSRSAAQIYLDEEGTVL